MALRDQPYLPLYIQDFLTDEKLIECSAQTTGVYIRLMCILHKSEDYGKILLKQKDKQTTEQNINFASKLAKQMPYPVEVVNTAITELLAEGVLTMEGDYLVQKRMVKDNLLSLTRSKAGKSGGQQSQSKNFAQAKVEAKQQANTQAKERANSENENEYETEIENVIELKESAVSKNFKWFKSQFDEMFLETISQTHPSKDVSQAVLESYAHLASDKLRLARADTSDCKKLLNTWLSNQKIKTNGTHQKNTRSAEQVEPQRKYSGQL